MDHGQRAILALLALVAVLLGLNLAPSERTAQAQPQPLAGPVDPPTLVAGAAIVDPNSGRYVRCLRFWSDGAVDATLADFGTGASCLDTNVCGPEPILPGSCATDVDRDGMTGFDDLLDVLSTWGPCP